MEPLVNGARPAPPDTIHRIRRIFIESLHVNLPEDDFSYETKLDEAVGLDSVAVLEFVSAIEKQFGITFEPEMLNITLVRNLKQLAVYVDHRTARRGTVSEGPE